MKIGGVIRAFFFTVVFVLYSILSISQVVLVDVDGKGIPPSITVTSSNAVKRVPPTDIKSNSGGMGTEKSSSNPIVETTVWIDMNSNKIDPKLIVKLSILTDEINILKSELKKHKSNEDIVFMLKKQITSLKDRKKQIKKLRK